VRLDGELLAQQAADQYWKSYALKIPSLNTAVTNTRLAYNSAKTLCE